MKKIALFTALLALGLSLNAQNQLSSAKQELNRKYLSKAKVAIDKACANDNYKEDPETWSVAAQVYSLIGDAATNPNSEFKKYKDLDPDWSQKAYDAAMRCKELDKKGEYTSKIKPVFQMIGGQYYDLSVEQFNSGNYKDALENSDKAAKILNNSGDPDLANASIYICGLCCQNLKDMDGVKKYYAPLVRKTKVKDNFKPQMKHVYNTMLGIYKEAKDTANVIKTGERYTKAMPEDPSANILLADAYNWTGNNAKAIALANKTIDSTKNSPDYFKWLCAAASIYAGAGDYATAEAKYKESSTLQPNQLEANSGMATMLFRRAIEKDQAIAKLGYSDEDLATGDKLTKERNEFLTSAIDYLKNAIKYIDGLNAEEQAIHRQDLYSCLRTLNTCYMTLEMYDASKPIKERIDKIEAGANN